MLLCITPSEVLEKRPWTYIPQWELCSFTAMATLSLPLHSQIALWRQRRRRHDLFETISSCHQFKHAGWRLQVSYKGLETLYDDGYQKAKDLDYYYRSLGELVEHDSGPPRLFCPVDAGSPIEDAPLMLYLPGTVIPNVCVVESSIVLSCSLAFIWFDLDWKLFRGRWYGDGALHAPQGTWKVRSLLDTFTCLQFLSGLLLEYDESSQFYRSWL